MSGKGATQAADGRTVAFYARPSLAVVAPSHLSATPHIAQNTKNRRSRIDGRTTRHKGCAISIAKRPLVEAPSCWLKQNGLQHRPMFRGVGRVGWAFTFAAMIFNLLRVSNQSAPTGRFSPETPLESLKQPARADRRRDVTGQQASSARSTRRQPPGCTQPTSRTGGVAGGYRVFSELLGPPLPLRFLT